MNKLRNCYLCGHQRPRNRTTGLHGGWLHDNHCLTILFSFMTLALLPQQELCLAPFDAIISIILQDLGPWGHHFVFRIHLLSSIAVGDPFPLLHTTLWKDQPTICPLSSLWTDIWVLSSWGHSTALPGTPYACEHACLWSEATYGWPFGL